MELVTVRNVFAERQCFHKCVSRILLTKGVVSQHALGQNPPPVRHSPGQTPPDQTPSPGQTLPWSDTPLVRHPPGEIPPVRYPPPPDEHCSGRYASYWNVFFLCKCFHIRNFVLQLQSIVRTSSFILLSSEQIVPKIEKNVKYLYNVKMFKCAFFSSPDAFQWRI